MRNSHSQHYFEYFTVISTRNLLKVHVQYTLGGLDGEGHYSADRFGFLVSAIVSAHTRAKEHKVKWAQADVNILVTFCYVYQFTSGLGESATLCLTQTIFYMLSTAIQLLATADL